MEPFIQVIVLVLLFYKEIKRNYTPSIKRINKTKYMDMGMEKRNNLVIVCVVIHVIYVLIYLLKLYIL